MRAGAILLALLLLSLCAAPLVAAEGAERSARVAATGSAYLVSIGVTCPEDENGRSYDCGTLQRAGFDSGTAALFRVDGHEGHAFSCEARSLSPLTSIAVAFDLDGDGFGDVAYGGTTLWPTVRPTPQVSGHVPASWNPGVAPTMTVHVEGGAAVEVTCAF